MKKGLLLAVLLVAVVFVTACGSNSSKSSRSLEDLLDQYVEAYTKADVKLAKDLFPSYYIDYVEERGLLTKDQLEASLENAKEEYGDDFHITYEINGKTKMTSEELDELNEKMASRYEAKEKASECYTIDGTITFAGSKYEDPDPLSSMAYCKYSDGWFLVGA